MIRHLAVLVALALSAPAVARDATPRGPCPADAPEGVRLPDRLGCRERTPLKAGRAPGTIEIAPGTTLRMGGRVRYDYEMRR